MTLTAVLERGGRVQHRFRALNDVVVANGALARIVRCAVSVDGLPFTTYRADGVIVATPTGSTAYSLSVGGPIVEPTVELLLVSPISPHTLSHRPVVLRPEAVVRITIEPGHQDAILTVDGQEGTPLAGGDVVVVRRAREPVSLVRSPDRTHYDVLRSKLGWGALQGGGHAARAARL
jgi:NAD+ kinase